MSNIEAKTQLPRRSSPMAMESTSRCGSCKTLGESTQAQIGGSGPSYCSSDLCASQVEVRHGQTERSPHTSSRELDQICRPTTCFMKTRCSQLLAHPDGIPCTSCPPASSGNTKTREQLQLRDCSASQYTNSQCMVSRFTASKAFGRPPARMASNLERTRTVGSMVHSCTVDRQASERTFGSEMLSYLS